MAEPRIKTSAFLANMPMFQQLAPADLERIAEGTTELRVPKGKMLFQRGDPCVGFHVVVYGQVKLGFVSPQGAEKVVEIIQAGQSFGEALMFTDRPYVVFAQCLVDSLLLHISKEVIDAEIARDPRLARRMIAGLSMRLHGLIQDVEAYSLRSGMQRVIGYLLRDLDNRPGGDDSATVMLDAQKGVIASRLNLTPEHFSRVLNEMAHEGLITVHGAQIQILDAQRMRGVLS